jgi:hypothetical protein
VVQIRGGGENVLKSSSTGASSTLKSEIIIEHGLLEARPGHAEVNSESHRETLVESSAKSPFSTICSVESCISCSQSIGKCYSAAIRLDYKVLKQFIQCNIQAQASIEMFT